MTGQPNRLEAGSHALGGRLIDRARPIGFTLNGRAIAGFAGDTVLSATLANGITAAGTRDGAALGLSEDFSLSVIPTGGDLSSALPMARLPAIDGADLTSVGARASKRTPGGLLGAARNLLFGPGRTLGHIFDRASALAGPWVDQAPETTEQADLAVVGGGVAGMSAALAAAHLGERIVLVERSAALGGLVDYFGAAEGEEPVDSLIARLSAEIAAQPNITVHLNTDAFGLYDRELHLHQVTVMDGVARGRVVAVDARRIVLATGARERLPVFANNRAPGVITACAAYALAERYGVWMGRKSLVATAGNAAYRLARLARDADREVLRIVDLRRQPQSRFIDFAKAYGIPLARGLQPHATETAGANLAGLWVRFSDSETAVVEGEPIWTEQFIVSGGWQPALTLWHMAGGGSRWNEDAARIDAAGAVEGVALAGSVAGYQTSTACMQSGAASVAGLFARRQGAVEDHPLSSIYETPDAPTSIARVGASGLCYLDSGYSLTVRPAPPRPRRWPRLSFQSGMRFPFAEQTHALSISDISAAVQMGAVPPADAAGVAAERCVMAGDLVGAARNYAGPPAPPLVQPSVPAYLCGRFGPQQVIWIVAAVDGRTFEPGCAIHARTDTSDPRLAIGVVLGGMTGSEGRAYALIGKPDLAAGDAIVIRDLSGAVEARAIEAFAEKTSEPAGAA